MFVHLMYAVRILTIEMQLFPPPPPPPPEGYHACSQALRLVTKEKGLPVLALHTGLLLKRGGGGGGGAEKARITKEKGRPVLTLDLHTGFLLKGGGGGRWEHRFKQARIHGPNSSGPAMATPLVYQLIN